MTAVRRWVGEASGSLRKRNRDSGCANIYFDQNDILK